MKNLILLFTFLLSTSVLVANTTDYNSVPRSSYLKMPVFDWQYYYNSNPDITRQIGRNKKGLENHWLKYGMKQGRASSPKFNVKKYVNGYRDLKKAFGSNWKRGVDHFVTNGIREGRNGNGPKSVTKPPIKINPKYLKMPIFDWQYYYNSNPDIARQVGKNRKGLEKHWIKNGMKEGRASSSKFHSRKYVNGYRDLKKAFGSNWKKGVDHYLSHGIREGRNGNGPKSNRPVAANAKYLKMPIFDWQYYYNSNPDIARQVGKNRKGLEKHWIKNGMKEGRASSSKFHSRKYVNGYRDLKKAFGSNWKKGVDHYLSHGIREGRNGNGPKSNRPVTANAKYLKMPIFDWQYYYNSNPDIARQVGKNRKGLEKHWIKNGMKEGRASSSKFHSRKYINGYSDLKKAFGSNWKKGVDHYLSHGIREGRSGLGPKFKAGPCNTQKCKDMRKIVKAAIRGPKSKRIKINGHNFVIKKAKIKKVNGATVITGKMSHHLRAASDDQIEYTFTVSGGGHSQPAINIKRGGFRKITSPIIGGVIGVIGGTVTTPSGCGVGLLGGPPGAVAGCVAGVSAGIGIGIAGGWVSDKVSERIGKKIHGNWEKTAEFIVEMIAIEAALKFP